MRPTRPLRWVADAMVPLTLSIVTGVAVLLPAGLAVPARVALFVFAVAVILWSTTALNTGYVALAALTVLVVTGGSPQELLFDSLASDVIWLMIGAFVLGEAVQRTGLARRLTEAVVARAHTVRGVFWLVAGVLVVLSLVIPSTSGRAAVTIPIYRSIAEAAGDRQVSRALALLMPTVILVATVATLIGAGSHLIANDLLERIAGRSISFAEWALWGVPFALAASGLSCWVILRMFLDGERRRARVELPRSERTRLSTPERKTLVVAGAMLALWLSEAAHGLEIATVTVAGALLLTAPGVGVLTWKAGVRSVSWNLVLFVGAALALGTALVETGAARWLIGRVFELSGIAGADSTLLVLLLLALITLTSHMYITSHAARAAALTPPLLYLAGTLEVDPVAVLFIATVGMDYCLTFPVSSKALLMFQELGDDTFQPADLLRLSSVMLVAHVVLIAVFYFGYWQWVGLAL